MRLGFRRIVEVYDFLKYCMVKNLRIHDQALFFLGATGVVSGIFLTNIFREHTIFLLLFVGILSIQILFFFRSLFLGLLFFFFCFSLGGHMSLERLQDIDMITALFEKETVFFTQEVRVTGTLREKLGETEKSARYILRGVTLGTEKLPEKVGILITFSDSRHKNIDDIIAFTGKLMLPRTNETFDYRTYLLLDQVYATTFATFPDKVGVNPSKSFTVFIRETREKLLTLIEDIYPGESAKLLE